MKRCFLPVICSIFLTLSVYGFNLRTVDGKTLRNAKVTKVSHRGLHISHEDGMGVYAPDSIQPAFHRYIPDEIAKYNKLAHRYRVSSGTKNLSNMMKKCQDDLRLIPELEKAIQENPEAGNIEKAKEALEKFRQQTTANVAEIIKTAREFLAKSGDVDEKTAQKISKRLKTSIAHNPHAANIAEAQTLLCDIDEKVITANIAKAQKILDDVKKNPEKHPEASNFRKVLQQAVKQYRNALSLSSAERLIKELDKAVEDARRELERREAERRRREEPAREEERRRQCAAKTGFTSTIPIANNGTFKIDWSISKEDVLRAGGSRSKTNNNEYIKDRVTYSFAFDGGLQEVSVCYFVPTSNDRFFTDTVERAAKYYGNIGILYELKGSTSASLLNYHGRYGDIYYAVILFYDGSGEAAIWVSAYNAHYYSREKILRGYKLCR